MTAYNQVNGQYAGGNDVMLNDVLKNAWGYRGWAMSDWGATPSWEFEVKGLDLLARRRIEQFPAVGAEANAGDKPRNRRKPGPFAGFQVPRVQL